MVYSNSEIQTIKNSVTCCLGNIAADISDKVAFGKGHKKERLEFKKVFLYMIAINTWSQNYDGSVNSSTENILKEKQKDNILSKLQDICNCGCNPEDESASDVERYVSEDYGADSYLIVK